MHIPPFPGWHLLGSFPAPEDDGVGSWLLHDRGDALLLEIPPGVTAEVVRAGLARVGATLRYATASHEHEDHFDPDTWAALQDAFPLAGFLRPGGLAGDIRLPLGAESVWLVAAPKHSRTDVVTVFRGVAMTGDIELTQLASVNREVPKKTKIASMRRLAGFEARAGYHVHTTVSAHLNSLRTAVHWPDLFATE